MSAQRKVSLSLELVDGYEFRVRFEPESIPELLTDEAPPLGRDAGPNPAQLLAAAVANCLAASLLFALRKFRNEPGPLRATVEATMARNETGRWRISAMDVALHLADAVADFKGAERALAQFEDFCIVTESVRQGIPVQVRVTDASGAEVHGSGTV